jgi:16S rRNA (cytosine967-C5)-methyltransferase
MVIEKATPRIPADLLLRQTLSRRKRLTRGDSAWISRAVFSYFRWLNWLPENAPLPQRIEGALELANRFALNPAEVSDTELLRRAVPEWIGAHLSLTGEWVRALQTEPSLWLRARKGAVSDLKNVLGNCDPSGFDRFPQSFRYTGEEDLFRHQIFQAGAFEIQDIASQAVGLLCAPKADEIWWDTCAGEGGKTLHLSDLMDGKGLIWATDRSEWRLDRLKLRAGRAGCFNYRSRAWDGSANLPTNTQFDGILVDAPCSGIGTWGRNPHSRWTVTPQDVSELAVIQKQILHNAASALKVGGRLFYAVCTLSRAETWEVAAALTEQHPELEPLPLENPFKPGSVPVTALTLWPQDTLGNGMFVAGWRRKA